MEPYQRITVALSRADSDSELIGYARRLAELEPGAAFQFVHVLDWPGSGENPKNVIRHERARAQIELAVARGFPAGGECRVLHGSRLDRLLEFVAEQQSGMILVGHRPNRSGRRSLARRLAMQAPCSLWIVPEGSQPAIRGVLCAIDFSPHSALALSTAALIARRAGLFECVALHVFFGELTAGLEDSETIARRQVRAAFERFVAPLELEGVRVRPVFVQGPSVEQAAARLAGEEGLDLLVMGTRGQSRSASILLGSESEHVLMETRIPALVVKQRGERLSLLEALFDREFTTRAAARFG